MQLFDEMLAAKLVPNAALFAMLITACERKVLTISAQPATRAKLPANIINCGALLPN